MVWVIIQIYTSKCAQMDPQQLPITSKLYSKSKKCDIKKPYGGGYHPPLVARRLMRHDSFLAHIAFANEKNCLSVCFSVRLSGCLFVSQSICLFVCLFVCPPIITFVDHTP